MVLLRYVLECVASRRMGGGGGDRARTHLRTMALIRHLPAGHACHLSQHRCVTHASQGGEPARPKPRRGKARAGSAEEGVRRVGSCGGPRAAAAAAVAAAVTVSMFVSCMSMGMGKGMGMEAMFATGSRDWCLMKKEGAGRGGRGRAGAGEGESRPGTKPVRGGWVVTARGKEAFGEGGGRGWGGRNWGRLLRASKGRQTILLIEGKKKKGGMGGGWLFNKRKLS